MPTVVPPPPPERPTSHPLLRALRGHPPEAALERLHARGAGPSTAEARLARHVARCSECRAWLRWRAALGAAARDLAGEHAPAGARPDVLAGALARRAAGERGPAFDARYALEEKRPARGGRGATLAGAAAAGIALAAALLARPGRDAGAGTVSGELWLTPTAPRAGDTLAVRYRPRAELAGAPRLRLRAVFHPDDDTRPWLRPAVTAAWLTPDGAGEYRGRAVLPPGAAYAQFAVEDSAARSVDAHSGEPWDVIVADAAGRPRMAGIRSQGIAADDAAWEHTRAVALEATRVHPEHPSGWWVRTQQDASLVGSAGADSVAAASRPLVARLDTALGRAPVRESWAMLDMTSFAEFAGMPDVGRRWRARLVREAPRSVAAYSLRMQALWAAKASPAAQLDSLERWWAADGDSLTLFVGQGVGLAMAAHDTAAARRWAARAVGAAPVASVFVAQQLVRDRALAAAGVASARADVARLAAGDAERPLGATAEAWDRERARRARATDAVVGEGLLTLGRPREAAAALTAATAAGWNADAFRLLGEARLALGDTAAALDAFAHAAADPGLAARVAARLTSLPGAPNGRAGAAAAWARAVAGARRTMHARVLQEIVAEAPRPSPRLGDAAGRRRRLAEVAAGRVALVAMVNARCGAALADLPALARLSDGLRGRSVAVVAVTDDAAGGAGVRALRDRGLTAPLWYDLDGEATAALDARGTPTYVVLDRSGAVRWRGHRALDAAPVLDALLAQGAGG